MSSSGGDDCCPLVVDPLTLITLASFLAAATYLLWVEITMSNLMVRRKRRDLHSPISDILHLGKFLMD